MKKKTVYCTPVTEVLLLGTENLMDPASWNPDYPHTGNMGIVEEDPEGDGHGAKANDPYAFVDIDWDEDFWESDIKSLWD